MKKAYDVIALGELLIDFTENGVSGQGNPIFEANPGGAPCNVLAMLNNLGKKTSFLGVVGKDQFGTTLRKTLNELGIDTSHLYEDEEVHTTLAFVHTFEDGDRDFAFYRNPGADMILAEEQIDEEYIKSKIEERNDAKKNKNYELADSIRNELLEKGIVLKDTREGTTYEVK